MTDKESKQLLTISMVGDNVDIEVNRDNIDDLRALAQMVSDNPGMRESLADMFRNIVGAGSADLPVSAPEYADECGAVFLQLNGASDDMSGRFSAGMELLTAAIAKLASEAIDCGLDEADVMKQVVERFASALTNAIPSVQVKAIGGNPFEPPISSNGGSRFLS